MYAADVSPAPQQGVQQRRSHYIMPYMRTSLRQKQGDKCHNKPQPRTFREGCPSAACISEVQRGLQLPADIQLEPFVCFAPVTPLCSCCHLSVIPNGSSVIVLNV